MAPPPPGVCALHRFGQQTHRTSTAKGTLDPKWRETFTFNIDDTEDSLFWFDVKDAGGDADSDHEILGQGSCDARDLPLRCSKDVAMRLRAAGGSFFKSADRGQLNARFRIVEAVPDVAGEAVAGVAREASEVCWAGGKGPTTGS